MFQKKKLPDLPVGLEGKTERRMFQKETMNGRYYVTEKVFFQALRQGQKRDKYRNSSLFNVFISAVSVWGLYQSATLLFDGQSLEPNSWLGHRQSGVN